MILSRALLIWWVAVLAASSSGFAADRSDVPKLLNGVGLVRDTDYPLEALTAGVQGRVEIMLDVGELGRVSGCTVKSSSGNAALDQRTCEVFTERARFQPARNSRGRATTGTYEQSIHWRMAEGDPGLPTVSLEFVYQYDASGKLRDCQATARSLGQNPTTIDCPPDAPKQAPTHLLDSLANGRARAVVQQQTIVGEAQLEPLEPLKRNERMMEFYRLRLTIGDDGTVKKCEVVESKYQVDQCKTVPPRVSAVRVGNTPQVNATVMFVRRELLRFADAADAGPNLMNAGELIGEDDYPPKAIDDDTEGRVIVRLGVDERGKVTNCSVETSSGSSVLDEQTCKLVKARAIFEPAMNNAGKAVASVYTRAINWRLEDPPTPMADWVDRMIITYSPNGAVKTCRRELEGAYKDAPQNCIEEAPELGGIILPRMQPLDATLELILEVRFTPRAMAPSQASDSKSEVLISRVVAELEIGPTGDQKGCRVVSSDGLLLLGDEVCNAAKDYLPFEPAADQRSPATRTGTLIMSASLGKRSMT